MKQTETREQRFRRLFGLRLRELRIGKGLTQRDLATQAGLSTTGLAHYEQGLREPAWSTIIDLAVALGLPTDAFRDEPSSEEKPKMGRPKPADETPAPPLAKKARGKRK